MKDLAIKESVLQEIMDLMDEKEGESLKSHPKLMAAKVEVAKPEDEAMEVDAKDPKIEASEDEVSPEMLQKLLEHFQSLK